MGSPPNPLRTNRNPPARALDSASPEAAHRRGFRRVSRCGSLGIVPIHRRTKARPCPRQPTASSAPPEAGQGGRSRRHAVSQAPRTKPCTSMPCAEGSPKS